MKITRSNYESWFLDYLEGNLDPALEEEFQSFMSENPDLITELNMGDLITLQRDDVIRFDSKELLKRADNPQQMSFDEQAVAWHEGDLTLSERVDFEAWLAKNPLKAVEATRYGQMKLIADQSVVFDHKEQLKRTGIIFPLWTKVAAAAALLVFAYLLFEPESRKPEMTGPIADLKTQIKKDVPGTVLKKGDKKTAITTPANQSGKLPDAIPQKLKQITPANKPERKLIPKPDVAPQVPVASPEMLKPRGIYFDMTADVELAVMTLKSPAMESGEQELSELLKVQLAAMRNGDDRELLSTEHLGLSGLQLFARLSGKRLTARKGADGSVKSVSFNSHLLAFSIPVNR